MLVLLLFFSAQLTLQYVNGAFRNEFGGHPDEASHYITGLMIHDYLSGRQWDAPREFAEDYYIHYPKVSLGHWPPFFYIVQALWTVSFSPSHTSLMLLMACLTTLLAGTVYVVAAREFGSRVGIVLGLLLLVLPLVQQYSAMLMAEILVALLNLWAVLCWGRFLDTEKVRWSLAFALWAVLAIFTKGNSLALAVAAPLAVLCSGRFVLMKRLAFWYPAGAVLVLCGFWYWLTLDMLRNGMQAETLSWQFTLAAIPYYASHLVNIGGVALTGLAVIGFLRCVIYPDSRYAGTHGTWSAVGALVISVALFHWVVPAGLEHRHLLTAVPALILLMAPGVAWVAQRLPLPLGNAPQRQLTVACLVLGVFVAETFYIPRQTSYGFGAVVQSLLAVPHWQKSVFFIASDSTGEGMFIAEVARQEQRPGHIVLRASKALSKSRWSGAQYSLLYHSPQEIMEYLESLPVGLVVIDHSFMIRAEYEHHPLLQKTLESYAHKWEKVGVFPITRRGITYPAATTVYRLIDHENKPVNPIRVDLSDMLGKSLEKKWLQ